MIGTLETSRSVMPIVLNEKAGPHLPTPELRRHFVEPPGPSHQVFHAPRCKQSAVGLQAMHPNVLGISDDASLPQLRRFLRFRAQADRTHTGDGGKRTAALLDTLCFVEVCDALFRHYMTYVVAVNHDRSYRHACLFPDFDSIQSLDERGYVALCKRLHSLNHQLSSPGGRAWICLQIEPGRTRVSAAMRIVSHVRCATKAADSTCCHGG